MLKLHPSTDPEMSMYRKMSFLYMDGCNHSSHKKYSTNVST
jgi:hypothetical protein